MRGGGGASNPQAPPAGPAPTPHYFAIFLTNLQYLGSIWHSFVTSFLDEYKAVALNTY